MADYALVGSVAALVGECVDAKSIKPTPVLAGLCAGVAGGVIWKFLNEFYEDWPTMNPNTKKDLKEVMGTVAGAGFAIALFHAWHK